MNEVFGFVLKRIDEHGLLSGTTAGVDSMLIEANAATNVERAEGVWRAYLERRVSAEDLELKTLVELA
ncbi:MAG: hypothetical protein NTW75_01555 [Planctomycetales bacterium]|nr:hypothetical protein [Planctomycetales bacterium]